MRAFRVRCGGAGLLAPVLALSAFLLAGCGTPYGVDRGYGGYTDSPIEKNLFRVAFTSPFGLGPQAAHDLALLRAAEVTRDHGYAWFAVVRENRGVTNRLELLPAQGYQTYYAQPTWVPGPNGPVMIMRSYPDWQWTGDATASVPVPYVELFFRAYAQRPAGKEKAYEAAEIIPRMRTLYKIKAGS